MGPAPLLEVVLSRASAPAVVLVLVQLLLTCCRVAMPSPIHISASAFAFAQAAGCPATAASLATPAVNTILSSPSGGNESGTAAVASPKTPLDALYSIMATVEVR